MGGCHVTVMGKKRRGRKGELEGREDISDKKGRRGERNDEIRVQRIEGRGTTRKMESRKKDKD